MRKNFVSVCGILSFFLFVVLIQNSFAQCGNYFKSNYRAVNKIYRVNGGSFLLNDWTGDGKSDFWNFQPNTATSTSNIIIYPSRPTGYWDWDNPIILTTTLSSNVNTLDPGIVVKDFNGDGQADLLIPILGNLIMNHNNGSGALIAKTPFFNPPEFQANFGYHDINGDGLPDWVNMVSTQTAQGSSVAYQPGQSNGTFGARTDIFTGTTVASSKKAVGDFNGDGKIDVAFSNYTNNSNVYRMARNMDSVNFEVGSPTAYGPSFEARFEVVKDFNNDGRMDILTSAYDSFSPTFNRKLFILYGQSDNSFITTEYPVNNLPIYKVLAAEINGDDKLDIIEISQKFYSIYKNDGGGNFTRTDVQKTLVNGKFEDFSGDGKVDVYYDDSAYPVRNLFNEDVVVIKENVCQPFGETKRANFETDSVGDLVIWNPANGNWRSFSPDLGFFGNNGTTRSVNWGGGSLGDIPAPGDFDSDGITDYTVYRSSTGEWWTLLSSTGSVSVIGFGLAGDVAVPADYDGGGKTDIAVFRPSEGIWYIRYTETQTVGAARFGVNGDKPVPADYDGDGKTDIAVFRPSGGSWYILRSTDFGFSAASWGISTDKPVPADYDGDGKADIAVFRNGDWYIFRSMNNSLAFIHWGSAGDLPIPSYQNGEIAELVVYRPGNFGWYNFRSQFAVIAFGQSQSTPVYFGLPNN